MIRLCYDSLEISFFFGPLGHSFYSNKSDSHKSGVNVVPWISIEFDCFNGGYLDWTFVLEKKNRFRY
jgi:hypothetical protein